MQKIIKEQQIVEDQWQLVAGDAQDAPDGQYILPLALWLTQQDRSHKAVWLDSHESPDLIDVPLDNIPLIALNFPSFMDGRCFSYARELYQQGYRGEIRAIGHFIRDQLYYLQQCGFNSFSPADDIDLAEALNSFNDFNKSYCATSQQHKPLFTQ